MIARTPVSRYRNVLAAVLVIYAVGLVIGTHMPNPQEFLPSPISDKWLHVLAYLGLGFLAALAVSARLPMRAVRGAVVIVCVAAFGGLDELTQELPRVHRDAEWLDWLVDVAGGALGVVAWRLLRRGWPHWWQSAEFDAA